MIMITPSKILGTVITVLLCNIALAHTAMANIHSTLLSAPKTSLPIPSPTGNVTPGARNFIHASIKLMAHTKPIQVNRHAVAMGCGEHAERYPDDRSDDHGDDRQFDRVGKIIGDQP